MPKNNSGNKVVAIVAVVCAIILWGYVNYYKLAGGE